MAGRKPKAVGDKAVARSIYPSRDLMDRIEAYAAEQQKPVAVAIVELVDWALGVLAQHRQKP